MSVKNSKRGKNTTRVLTSSTIPDHILVLLHEAGDRHVSQGGEKHALFCDMMVRYAKAWQKGRVPRVHIGMIKERSSQQSFYVADVTRDILQVIAKSDGVSVSQVIRTAICWHMFSKGAGSKRDLWNSDFVLGDKGDFDLPN